MIFSGPQIQNMLHSTTLTRDLFKLCGEIGGEVIATGRRSFIGSQLERDRSPGRQRTYSPGSRSRPQGPAQDTIAELRRGGDENRLLLYYGNMFLGAAAGALGLIDEARQAYQRAGGLYPLA